MCRVLGVPRSSYYAHRKRPPSARAAANEKLRVEIRSIHAMSGETYGSPRVHADLQAQGIQVGRNRVARLMAQDGLVVKRPQRFCTTTDSRHEYPIAPNVLAREFSVESVGGLDRVWVADITYVPTQAGWLYLAVVLDLASRRVVGWAMKDTMQTALGTTRWRWRSYSAARNAGWCTTPIAACSTPPEPTGISLRGRERW